MNTSELLVMHAAEWQAATRHPFLDGIRTGALPDAALNTWLVQDYHFVDMLLRSQSLLLACAPRQDQPVLAQGLVALTEELDWFEGIALSRRLILSAQVQPGCEAYAGYLLHLGAECRLPEQQADSRDEAYAAGITALWTVERAYLDAWLSAQPGAPAFRAFVEHWTTDGFHDYVDGLAAAADRALRLVPAAQLQAEQAFQRVADYEGGFWQMAFSSLT